MAANDTSPARKITSRDYKDNSIKPQWCPSCGDFAVLKALKDALLKLQIDPHDLVMTAGIGCSGRTWAYLNGFSFHGAHGRALPVATGVKLANEGLKVIIVGGDGDGYAIGAGHFIHAVRRNVDMTYVVMDNQDYGLTKGQVSPTSAQGYKTSTSPEGNIEAPLDPILLALASGASFVARGFSGNPTHLADLMVKGITHKGFSLVEIMSPCPVFNRVNTYDWYRQRLHYLDQDSTYDPGNLGMALQREATDEMIGLGIIYRNERPTYEEMRPGRNGVPVVELPITGIDYSPLIQEFL